MLNSDQFEGTSKIPNGEGSISVPESSDMILKCFEKHVNYEQDAVQMYEEGVME